MQKISLKANENATKLNISINKPLTLTEGGVYISKIKHLEEISTLPSKLKVVYTLKNPAGENFEYAEFFFCGDHNARWNTFLKYINANCLIPEDSDASCLVGLEEIVELAENAPGLFAIISRKIKPKDFTFSNLSDFSFNS